MLRDRELEAEYSFYPPSQRPAKRDPDAYSSRIRHHVADLEIAARRQQLPELKQDAHPDQREAEHRHNSAPLVQGGQKRQGRVRREVFDLVADVQRSQCLDWSRIARQQRAYDKHEDAAIQASRKGLGCKPPFEFSPC